MATDNRKSVGGLFLLSLLALASGRDSLPIRCQSTSDCEDVLRVGSECIEGTCTNPFRRGCLQALQEGWGKPRVCHSGDYENEYTHYCQSNIFNYMEIRLAALGWQSAIFQAWILQILLSELVGVPATIETGSATGNLDFYDPQRAYDTGEGGTRTRMQWTRKAYEVGDCLDITPGTRRTNNNVDGGEYEPCAHVIPETCASVAGLRAELEQEGITEKSVPIGGLSEIGWFIPKFTLAHDPSLGNYEGLMGEANRKKLAETFKRPTKWKDYCELISESRCSIPDDVARRPPRVNDTAEQASYFVEDQYTGFFRDTPESDCKVTSDCKGNFIDYPCGWNSFFHAQSHHLNIALESNGDEPVAHGYTYKEMVQIWKAVNATKSHAMIMSWAPDTLYQTWFGTDAEFVKVGLPSPTLDCLQNRPNMQLRCDPEADPIERLGEAVGTCDYPTALLTRTVSSQLHVKTFDPEVSEEQRSPGYDLIRSFTMTELQLGQIMDYWSRTNDPREATCQWVVDNLDTLKLTVPASYPRVILEDQAHLESPLFYISLTLACTAAFVVSTTAVFTLIKRDSRAIKYAQIGFLRLILVGLLMVTVGSIVMVLPATDATCIATSWLIVVGYTFELIPLLVKVAAVNQIMRAAKKMKRVTVDRNLMFGVVAATVVGVSIYMAVWTAVDPYKRAEALDLTQTTTESGETIVASRYFCASNSDTWRFISVAANLTMLLCATVLAIQTRNIRDELNESLTLSLMIYGHFLFMVLRIVLIAIEGMADLWNLPLYHSIIFSLDAMLTCGVYFLPKFLAKELSHADRIGTSYGQHHSTFSQHTRASYNIPNQSASQPISFGSSHTHNSFVRSNPDVMEASGPDASETSPS